MMERPSPTITPRVAGFVILILAVVGSVSLWAGNPKLGSSGTTLGASIAHIAGLLGARSPGERTKAELTKSKQSDHSFGPPAEPAGDEPERVLGKVFPPDTDDHLLVTPEELLNQGPPAIPTAESPAGDGIGLSEIFSEGPVLVGGGDGPGPIMGGGSSGGGGGGGGGGGSSPIPPAEVPAVPEPSTWVLMLMGAAMCGASMRRQRRLQLQTAA